MAPSSSRETPFIAGDQGLTWADGVEPGDPAQCEAPSGNRCFWIDADAPTGGDGSFASPYNSFEQAIGYTDVALQGYVPGALAGGDVVYVRGTFLATLNDEASHKTKLEIARASQGGTPEAPTVVKSWRGSPRAVFDGALTESDLISVRGATAVRLENLEVRAHSGRGVDLGDRVEWLDVHSVFVHDGIGDGESGIGGGIMLHVEDNGTHDFTVRNCFFVNNAIDTRGVDGNIGGLSILSEPSAGSPSNVRVLDSVFDGEVTAIRHKHTGPFTVEASNNVVTNCGTAFGQRGAMNRYHHNIVVGCAVGIGFDSWNFNIPTSEGDYAHNTFFEVPTLLELSMEYPDSPGEQVTRIFRIHDNIVANTGMQTDPMVRFNEIAGTLTEHTVIDFDRNLFSYAPRDAVFVRSPTQTPSTMSFEEAMAAYSDTTSFFGEPMFTNAAGGDFALQPGSPARGAAGDGTHLGAVQD